jgi:hypothetical protein
MTADQRRVAALEFAIASAIDELRRWQYSDDPEDIRHSIDTAIHTLQRA